MNFGAILYTDNNKDYIIKLIAKRSVINIAKMVVVSKGGQTNGQTESSPNCL